MKKMARKVNIKDVAAAAEVSIATVSRVLNGKTEHIKVNTQQKVHKAVEDLGYIPNDIARRLKNNQSGHTLGLILPDFSSAFSEIARGAEDEATKRDYDILVSSANNDAQWEERCVKTLASRVVDGIIYASSNSESGERILLNAGIPVIAVDRKLQAESNEGLGYVGSDNYAAMYKVAQLVAQRGCKKIGYITADIKSYSAAERFRGLCDGLRDSGIPFDSDLLIEDEFTIKAGYDGIRALLQKNSELDCVVCGNDCIAIGVMQYCNETDALIPQQMKIVSFGDIYPADYTNCELTTAHRNLYEMGKAAAAMLIDYLETGKPLDNILFEYQIVTSKSI